MDELKKEVIRNFIRNNIWISFLLIFLILLIFVFFMILFFKTPSCNDGTSEGECSDIKPFFCEKKHLIEKSSVCGCPETTMKNGDSCISNYSNYNYREVTFYYILDNNRESINFVVNEGFYNHIKNLPRFFSIGEGETLRIEEFYLRSINNEEQRAMLLPLIVKIKEATSSKNEQAKIVISLVQNLDYNVDIFNGSVWKQASHSKYPYELLYEGVGDCQEKSRLLAFLLKELGYGSSIFYFRIENHEAVGIKCPFYRDYKDTGYCFIETTGVLNNGKYIGSTQSFAFEPKVIVISNGKSGIYWF